MKCSNITRQWIRRSYELNIETRSLLYDRRHGDTDRDGTRGHAERTVAHRQSSVARSFGNIAVMANDSVSAVTIHLPHWLTGAVWRIWIQKPCWDLRLRQYNIRSEEAEIFVSVRGGDVEKMLHLFERRDASPFDRDAKSRSLLYVSNWNKTTPPLCWQDLTSNSTLLLSISQLFANGCWRWASTSAWTRIQEMACKIALHAL